MEDISSGKYKEWNIFIVKKYVGKQRIHMKMVMMRKGKEKHKCHVKKYNTIIKMKKKHFY
jgi:hypothetical protein